MLQLANDDEGNEYDDFPEVGDICPVWRPSLPMLVFNKAKGAYEKKNTNILHFTYSVFISHYLTMFQV